MSWLLEFLARLFGAKAAPPPPPPKPQPQPPPPPPPPPPSPIDEDEKLPPKMYPMESTDMPASSNIIPLFGPCHPGWEGHPGPDWVFPDTANTSNTENLYFGTWLYDEIAYSPAIVVWQPTDPSQWVKLIWMPTGGPGYGTWHDIAMLQGERGDGVSLPEGWGPRSWRPDLTAFLQERRAAREDIYLGINVKGNSNAIMMLWKSNIHIVHDRKEVEKLEAEIAELRRRLDAAA